MMRASSLFYACLAAVVAASDANITRPLTSRQILPSTFTPPQVFENVNLVRNIDLQKGYPRETINVVVKNVDSKPQSEYYLPFEVSWISRIGGLEVRDKKDASKPSFNIEVTEYDAESTAEYFLIHLPEALKPAAEITLNIKYTVLSALEPRPATIDQASQQHVQYTFSAYTPSAYKTKTQKTKIKFPSANVPDYTVIPGTSGNEDPTRQGSTFTYGPYETIPAGSLEPVSVRYEYTKPLIHCTLLERDIEVSHWGGNLATEERYWMGNRAASLKNHFNRVQWQMTQYANPPTAALKELRVPLRAGSTNPYFIDDIGNVSTSRWRSNAREAGLELKPRYPVFGGWKYSFKIGWDGELKDYLRRLKGEGYVLRVPLLEGPKMNEGIEYDRLELRVILPEGAKNIRWSTPFPSTFLSEAETVHRSFMDTIGRPTLKLHAINVVDEWRDTDLLVTYDYPWTAGYRKPLTIATAILSVFAAAWVVGSLDLRIGKAGK